MNKIIQTLILFMVFAIGIVACAPAATPIPSTATLQFTATDIPPTATQLPAVKIDPKNPLAVKFGQNPYSYSTEVTNPGQANQSVTVNFYLYLPETYGQDPKQKWPLLLSLHGSYQIGDNVTYLLQEGLAPILVNKTDFPFIVVSPQLPRGLPAFESWTDIIDSLKLLLDQVQSFYDVDPNRVSVTGFSMGGFGTWEFALRYPNYISAIAPIAGGYIYQSEEIPSTICALKDLPIWVFHGQMDNVVDPKQAIELVDALKKCGGNPRFTLYPNSGHVGTWTKAYIDPELFTWLLAQSRPQ